MLVNSVRALAKRPAGEQGSRKGAASTGQAKAKQPREAACLPGCCIRVDGQTRTARCCGQQHAAPLLAPRAPDGICTRAPHGVGVGGSCCREVARAKAAALPCPVRSQVAYTLLTGSFTPGAVTDVANWASLPLVFGIMTFCYSGHGVFPAIQKSMQTPKQFPQVRRAGLGWRWGGVRLGCAGLCWAGVGWSGVEWSGVECGGLDVVFLRFWRWR